MNRILHASDLHLSLSEKDYTLSVLEEIFTCAEQNNADYLLFAGDTFDSFSDAEKLRTDFRVKVNNFISNTKSGCRIIMIPGNHETHKQGSRKLASLDFGNITLVEEKPYSFFELNNIEFFVIPYSGSYSDSFEWELPEKKSRFRIAIAHASVSDLPYACIDKEDETSVLDMDFFSYHKVDYAALGHIHSSHIFSRGNSFISYPGAARIWRKGEKGSCYVNLVRSRFH